MVDIYNKCVPTIGAFDTETTGLNIALDKPFLFQFGFINREANTGYAFAVDIEQQPELANQVINYWQNKLAINLKKYFAHNVKYDLHMMKNNETPYTGDNLSDTMFYIRYAHDAVTPAYGGPTLALKEYATKYIDVSAKSHEQLLNSEKTAISTQINLKLKHRKQFVYGVFCD